VSGAIKPAKYRVALNTERNSLHLRAALWGGLLFLYPAVLAAPVLFKEEVDGEGGAADPDCHDVCDAEGPGAW